MSGTLSKVVDLVIETCWCGMPHGVPRVLRDHQRDQHANGEPQVGIYCPAGHQWEISGKPEVEKEREHRARVEARVRAIQDQLEAEARAHAATKGQLTKAKKRATNGICPCCNRTFVNVTRHMKTKHPDAIVAGDTRG